MKFATTKKGSYIELLCNKKKIEMIKKKCKRKDILDPKKACMSKVEFDINERDHNVERDSTPLLSQSQEERWTRKKRGWRT